MKFIIYILKKVSQFNLSEKIWLRDFLFFILYRIFKYRQKVVQNNLKQSFLDLSDLELRQIELQFYKNLIKIALETIEGFSLNEDIIKSKIKLNYNDEVLEIIKQKQNFIFTSGHSGNWELTNLIMALTLNYEIRAIYQPFSNANFDKYITDSRSRFGTKMFKKEKNVSEKVFFQTDKPFCLALINDQSPKPEIAYWTQFLNQETGFYRGPAELALKHNLPLVFMHVHRLDTGVYEVIAELIKDSDSAEEMLEEYVKKLESNIKKDPANWLWSHRRWKHTKPVFMPILDVN